MRFVWAALVAALGVCALGRSDLNPCHGVKSTYGKGVTCEKVEFPVGMCSACKLKPFNPFTGSFYNCAAIFDLDNPDCQAKLKRYAAINAHCDPIRLRQVQDFSNPSNRRGLDYFVYSVCEECCDCVPIGARQNQYVWRAQNNQLLNSKRGNCPAHAFYDLCAVLPNIRFSKTPGGQDHWDWPKICPLITKWQFSPASRNWLTKSYVNVDWRISRFLIWFFWDNHCGYWQTWRNCVALEHAQKRVLVNRPRWRAIVCAPIFLSAPPVWWRRSPREWRVD
ncbi:unnamed protein product [Agarophyton chilense]